MDGLTMLISTPRQALLPLFGVKTPGSARHSQYWWWVFSARGAIMR